MLKNFNDTEVKSAIIFLSQTLYFINLTLQQLILLVQSNTMKVIAILTTILLQSVRARRHNVFHIEPLVAMNFYPFDDVARPGSLTVYDNERTMYVAANDEHFLPPDDTIQVDDTSSVVANDEDFVPFLADAKYFQIHSLYEVDDTQVCLQPRSKQQGSTIVVRPCLNDSSRNLQWWTVDDFGQFRNKADSDLCRTKAPESKLKLKQCLERALTTKVATSSFIYNYFTNQIHFAGNPLRIVTVPNNLEDSAIVRLGPNTENSIVAASVENKVTKWALKFL